VPAKSTLVPAPLMATAGASGGGNVLRLISLWEQRRQEDPGRAGTKAAPVVQPSEPLDPSKMPLVKTCPAGPKLDIEYSEALLVDESLPRSFDDLAQLEHQQVCNVLVASSTQQCRGRGHNNEDRFVTASDSTADGMAFHVVGIMDGHDTAAASDTVQRLLPEVVSQHIKAGKPVAQAYTLAMADLEDILRDVHASAGTCVLSCVVAGRFVWCSNLGDCRAALIHLKQPEAEDVAPLLKSICWLSRDHKASSATETLRIREAGGNVFDGRVFGLEPSRTLGDFDVKEKTSEGVISIVPEVRRTEIGDGNSAAHALLICATDGVWDVLDGEDIVDVVRDCKQLEPFLQQRLNPRPEREDCEDVQPHLLQDHQQPLQDLADDLIKLSRSKGSMDDCTTIVMLISVTA